jgi:hypothetical protein
MIRLARQLADAALAVAGDIAEDLVLARARRWLGINDIARAAGEAAFAALQNHEECRDLRGAIERTATNIRTEIRHTRREVDLRAPEVPPGGWQVGEGFLFGVGTVRTCIDCGCLVGGGPTRCVRCAREATS